MDFKDHLKKYLSEMEINDLLSSLEKDPISALYINTNIIDKDKFKRFFPSMKEHPIIDNAFIFDKNIIQCGKSFYHDIGLYYISEPSALLVANLLNINKHDLILDMCAAPGGKTIQAALKAKGGMVLANDASYKRSLELANNVERMGLDNVLITCQNFLDSKELLKETFDKIILDAPCSGSGMFRKNEEMRNDWSINKVNKFASIQKDLLEKAIEMLKPGGTIAYSTCSFSYEEDEEVVLEALNKHKEMHMVNIPINRAFYRSKNLPEAIHLFPYLFNGEGHFIAILKKDGMLENNTYKIKINNLDKNELEKWGLINRYNFYYRDHIYSLPFYFDLNRLALIRPGLDAFVVAKDRYIPQHHLAKANKNDNLTIELDINQLEKYMHGETFSFEHIDGYVVATYLGFNIGIAKVVNKTLKNLYPKGLRRNKLIF